MLGMTKASELDLSRGAVWDISGSVGLGDCAAMGPRSRGWVLSMGWGPSTSSLVFLAPSTSKFPISLPGKKGGVMETGTAKLLFGLKNICCLNGKNPFTHALGMLNELEPEMLV